MYVDCGVMGETNMELFSCRPSARSGDLVFLAIGRPWDGLCSQFHTMAIHRGPNHFHLLCGRIQSVDMAHGVMKGRRIEPSVARDADGCVLFGQNLLETNPWSGRHY